MIDELLQLSTQIVDNCNRLLESHVTPVSPLYETVEKLANIAQHFSSVVSEMRPLLENENSKISSYSTELRTPVAAIRGFTQLSFNGLYGILTDIQHEYLTFILDDGEKLAELLDIMMGATSSNPQS